MKSELKNYKNNTRLIATRIPESEVKFIKERGITVYSFFQIAVMNAIAELKKSETEE